MANRSSRVHTDQTRERRLTEIFFSNIGVARGNSGRRINGPYCEEVTISAISPSIYSHFLIPLWFGELSDNDH